MTVAELVPIPSDADRLRDRLVEMREEMLGRMLRRGSVDPGILPLIAGIAAALRALDQSAENASAAAVDDAGEAIKLILHYNGLVAAVELAPVVAIRLAGELLDAAGLRLAGELAAFRRHLSNGKP